MSKKKILVLLVLGSFMFFSCASQKNFKSHSILIQLKGNPSTGYTWVHSLSEKNVVSISKKVEYLGAEGIVGAPSMFYFNVSSRSCGSCYLTLEYRRPWEKNKSKGKHFYYIEVSENGKIKLNEVNEINNESASKVSFKSLSMEEGLKEYAATTEAILLDVRRPDEYHSGHIPNAVLFPNEVITEDTVGKRLPDKKQKIFVYCRSGRRSKDASQKLVDLGYSNVIEIGGIIEYDGKLEM